MARLKTVEVRALLDEVNTMLRESTDSIGPFPCNGRERRLALCCLIETVLHRTGNYAGWGHLGVNEVPHGEWPGIMPLEEYKARGGSDEKIMACLATHCSSLPDRVFPDDSRRHYLAGNMRPAVRPLRGEL
jgi:hypothetical protein